MKFITGYKWWVVVAVVLFAGSLIAGMLTPQSILAALSAEIASLRQLGQTLAGKPPVVIAWVIFMRNALAMLSSFFLSPILLLVPVASLTANGLLLGSVAATVLQQKSLGYLLSGLLPHGIIELPAFVIGEAAALGFGVVVIATLFRKEKKAFFLSGLRRNLKYLAIALALLVPAALIEAFLTPKLIH